MPGSSGPSYGRAAMIGVLIALLLTVAAAVYALVARYRIDSAADEFGLTDPTLEVERLARLTVLLTILLISALLILLFVMGCYLVIRVGRIVGRPAAGPPTSYVDAWQQYRLTDEQIAAATAEHPRDQDGDQQPPGRGPRASGPGPDKPG